MSPIEHGWKIRVCPECGERVQPVADGVYKCATHGRGEGTVVEVVPTSQLQGAVTAGRCTPEMLTAGESVLQRMLQLWADESLREEVDARQMAGLVWRAMAPYSQRAGAAAALVAADLLADAVYDDIAPGTLKTLAREYFTATRPGG